MDVTARFFDGVQGQARDVHVRVVDGVALIRGADGQVIQGWPTRDMVARQTPDAAVVFQCGKGPARLIVSDPALLPMFGPSLRRPPRRLTGWATAVAACVAVAAIGMLAIGFAPGLLAPLVPLSWENAWGAPLQRALTAGAPACTAASGQKAIQTLAGRLIEAGRITAPVQVAVLNDAMVNAFTLPGNRVLIMRGLIAQAQDGDELAGVLAHELGHVKHRDPARQMLRQLGLNAVALAVGWGDFTGGGLATAALGLAYGRAAEAAADDFAIETLHEAGLRADGLATFFVHIQKHEGPAMPAFLSDHPPTAERLARAKQLPVGAHALTDTEWRAIRAMCDKAV